MQFWLRMSQAIDSLNDRIGRLVGWLTLAMVLIGSFNALARYLGRFMGGQLSSNAYLELQWYLFTLVFLLGASYTYRCNAHVRVDLLYGRLSERGKAWIDLVGTVVLLLPFCIFALRSSWPSVRNSWAVREMSSDPGGLARYPIKTVILVAFALLILQGISQVIKQLAILRGQHSSGTAEATREIHL
ncbi:MAG: TRAP transporter small permease subunit [Acidobacteriota bacterium]